MTMEDLKSYTNIAEAPEELLCLVKCINTKTGVIGEDGQIDFEKIKLIPTIAKMDEEKQIELKECAKNVGPIEECSDIQKLRSCLPEGIKE